MSGPVDYVNGGLHGVIWKAA